MNGGNENENILEAVFTQAFSPPASRRQSLQVGSQARTDSKGDGRPEGSMNTEQGSEVPNAVIPESSESTNSSWKAEYEVQVESWRARSAEARQKAEKERQRWEAIRAAEQAEAARRESEGIDGPAVAREERDADWETIPKKNSHSVGDPVGSSHSRSPADSRDFVTEEPQTRATVSSTNVRTPTGPHSQDNVDDSQKWEDVHSSITSSFPSMTFPERVDTPPSQHNPATAPAPLSATLTIFDSTLPTRTRVKALFSSLAINMLLPFVNGVMLGFGEIFAKNFVMEWLGWTPRIPGSVATTTGVGITSPWGQRQKRKVPE